MAASISAACNLQQKPGAISWYVPVVLDQSIQAKPVICITFILLIHGKRQFLAICELVGQRSIQDGSNNRMNEITA